MLDFGQGRLNHRFELGKALGGLHPIIAYPFEAFGHYMLDHAANEPVDIDGFVLDPFGSMSGSAQSAVEAPG